MALLIGSHSASQAGIAPGTQTKQFGCFDRWRRFLEGCGIQDKFITKFSTTKKSVYLERLLKVYKEMNMADNVKTNWDTAQLNPPLQTYVRSSGQSFGGTQF